MDQEGYLVWWTASSRKIFDFKYHPNHNVYSFTRKNNGTVRHYLLNNNFQLIDSLEVPLGGGDIHEFMIFPNGNYCFIGLRDSIMDLSGYTFNGSPGSATTNVANMMVWEYDTNHNLVFQWNALEHIPPDAHQDPYNYNPNNFDFIHANAIEYDVDGNLLLSLRTANAVYKIDHVTGDVLWRLGGQYNEFTFVNDSGFFAQHDVRRLPNGNITVFDNQHFAPGGSRTVEYTLDHVNHTATKVNEFDYYWPINAYSLGSYRKMNNGYGIIGWGNVRRPTPSISLIDSLNNVAADIFFEDTVVTYRAFLQSLPGLPAQPQITCISNDSTSATLSAPTGYNYYLWSNGATTPSITVADTGTYVVWVNHGMGMLGSTPFHLTNLQQCTAVGISTHTPNAAPTVIGYYDLLGRTVHQRRPGVLYLKVYSNGMVEKEVYWER